MEQQLTVGVSCGRLIVAVAGHAEGDSSNDVVLGHLFDLQAAALQDVGKLHFGRCVGRDRYGLRRLRLIAFRCVLLGDGVGAGQQLFQQQLTVGVSRGRLIVAVAGHAEGDSGHDAVLRGLFNF